jgi:hypothetical protein
MKDFLKKATSKGLSCDQTECGQHASCSASLDGMQKCACNEGYVSSGDECIAPPEFMPHALLLGSDSSLQTKARDINVALFGKNYIAVVFADMSQGGMGRVVVGNVHESGMATIAPPESFTIAGRQAFSPDVIGTDDNRILISWRDQNTNGVGWMRAAAMGAATQIPGAKKYLQWGKPVNFCHNQSHKAVAFPLPGNRAAVLFADRMEVAQNSLAELFGNSMLVHLSNTGAITSLGNYRFTDYAVCRLELTRLSPKTFVIAARGAPAIDEMDSSIHTNQETVALFGEMSGDELVFEPNQLNLEPQATDIWARGVSLIAPNTFAYAYQRGTDEKMMLGVVSVNATTRRMQVVHKPSEIRQGFSSYVAMLSVPYTASEPHTLTYYEGPKHSMVNVCSWDPARSSLSKCEDFVWLQGKVKGVSGVHLGGGKSLMVFASESGVPYYGVFGLAKK